VSEKKNRPTAHQGGLLQWKAYRVLEHVLEQPLQLHNMSAPEWKLLGLIYDMPETLPTEVASLMDVKLPLVTRNVGTLQEKGFITIKQHKLDKRAKCIAISQAGEVKLRAVDEAVRKAIGGVFKTATPSEFEAYRSVLEKIIENGSSC
jgi:MarR family transcriptional regulator, transcriptional regulator for hemolysin